MSALRDVIPDAAVVRLTLAVGLCAAPAVAPAGLFVARSIIVMYMAGVWLTLPWLWWRTGEPAYLFFALVANVVFPVAILPEIRQWRKIRREEKWNDHAEVMQLSGMGRGMLKMARFGLLDRRG